LSPSVFFVTLRRSRRVSSFKQRWRFFADAQNDKINAQNDRINAKNDGVGVQNDRADDWKDRVDAWKDRGKRFFANAQNDSTYYLSVTLNEVKGLFL